jgi:hypothetical protein
LGGAGSPGQQYVETLDAVEEPVVALVNGRDRRFELSDDTREIAFSGWTGGCTLCERSRALVSSPA